MLTVLRHGEGRVALSQAILATARSCIALLIERYKPDAVFMPCLAPEGLWKPFQMADVPMHYYRLRADLSPDDDDLAMALIRRAASARPIIVVINYCGYDMPMMAAEVLARQHGGLLMADNAQALFGPGAHAAYADVVVYSINKFLAVTDGALIVSRRSDANVEIKGELDPLPDAAILAYKEHLDANARTALAANIGDAFGPLIDSGRAYERYYSLISTDLLPRKPTQGIEEVFRRSPFDDLAGRRMWLSQQWPKDLKHLLWREGPCTFALPIDTKGRRHDAIDKLTRIGVIPSTWSDKWITPSKAYEHERRFYEDHILLPIDSRVTEEKLRECALVLGELIG